MKPTNAIPVEVLPVCPIAARKTIADADSVASQSQDYRGWAWILPRFKSSGPDLKNRSLSVSHLGWLFCLRFHHLPLVEPSSNGLRFGESSFSDIAVIPF